mgnify:CR=1 FL=1
MEFKVGDKVRILGGTKQIDWSFRMQITTGMVGEITEIDTHNPKYKVMFANGNSWEYNAEDLEKVVEDLRELIKPCYAVKIRDGKWLIALNMEDGTIEMFEIGSLKAIINIREFDKELKEKNSMQSYDIMEIRGYPKTFSLDEKRRKKIWERIEKSPTQIKLEELEKEQRKIADEIAELRKEL